MDAQQSTSTIECITNLSDENPQILQYCQIIPDDYDKNDIVYITYDTETDENSLFKLEEDNVEILKVDNGESIQIFQNEHMQEALQEENEGQLIDVSNLKPVALIDGTKAFIAQNPPEIIKASEIPEGTMLLQDCTEILKTESSDDQFIEESIAIENDDSGKTFQLLGKNFQQVQLEDGTFAIIEIHLFDSNNPERILPDDNEDNENTIALYETKKPSKKNKLYLCTHEGCNKAYTTFHHLKVHDRSHTGIRPYQCRDPGCGKAFATSYSLKTHLRTHSGEKPYACTVCPKRFKTSGDLHKHTRIHTGERPFHCLIEGCNMSFTTSNIRKVHMRTHTGERPFHCPEKGCGKAFSSATNYKNHLRVHSGEKPYMCKEPNCGKRFTEYSSLYKHQLVHSQENHNVCNLCGKNYRQVSTLRSHKRTVHGIKNETDVILTGVVDEQIKNDINLSNPDSPVQFTLLKTNGDHQDINNDIDDENVKQIQIGRICYINATELNL